MCIDVNGCQYSGEGRGDCGHAVGLPGESRPGEHDGPDDTVDVYGRPNGWCWYCWQARQIDVLSAKLGTAEAELADYEKELKRTVNESIDCAHDQWARTEGIKEENAKLREVVEAAKELVERGLHASCCQAGCGDCPVCWLENKLDALEDKP